MIRIEPRHTPTDDAVGNARAASRKLVPEEWLQRHGDVLWRIALRRLGSADLAEEVVQEALLAALSAMDAFEGRSSERTWLVAILLRRIAGRRRRDRTRRDNQSLDAMFDDAGRWKATPRGAPDPFRAEIGVLLEACLEELPESMWAAFYLREVLGMPCAALCEELGIGASNLGVRLHRARQHLRLCVERKDPGGKRGPT
jgi:RNA polymerase sigma-70 factor (ECF subfamily)